MDVTGDLAKPVFPTRTVDLLLIHAPAFFDFRGRDDIYFPYLSTSGDVPITPLYEYFPVGFKTIQRLSVELGLEVAILNLSTVLLKYPRVDLRTRSCASVNARLIGIDLHWMVHVQGSLAIAELDQGRFTPTSRSSSAASRPPTTPHELVRYPFIDMVLRGYDTHAPLRPLAGRAKRIAGGCADRRKPELEATMARSSTTV